MSDGGRKRSVVSACESRRCAYEAPEQNCAGASMRCDRNGLRQIGCRGISALGVGQRVERRAGKRGVTFDLQLSP